MSGKGKGSCAAPPISQALQLDQIGQQLSADHNAWGQEALQTLKDNSNLDSAGYAKEILESSLQTQYPSSLQRLIGDKEAESPQMLLAYLMAIKMRGDNHYRWTQDQMRSYLNAVLVGLGGKPIGMHTLKKWVAMHYDPAWEPRTKGQRTGEIIGNPLAAEAHLLRNKSRLREEHEMMDLLLDESREISRRIHQGENQNPEGIGLADKVRQDSENSSVDSHKMSLEYRAYVRALQQIIEKTGRVTPSQLPEGEEMPESTQLLFALIGKTFNQTLLKEGSWLYANNQQVSGKEAEEWWRHTMMQSLGILRDGMKSYGESGVSYKIVTESSSRDVYDLILTVQEPGKPPFHLTLQFKSYQRQSRDPSTSFQLCKLGGVKKADGTSRPRTIRELSEEISGRLSTTGAFANISIDPTREGSPCELRKADKVVHRAECLHPKIQEALTPEAIEKGFSRKQKNSSRLAKIPVEIDGQTIVVEVRHNKKGEVKLAGLTNACWVPINTATFLTETGARSDYRLLNRLIGQERKNLRNSVSGDKIIADAMAE